MLITRQTLPPVWILCLKKTPLVPFFCGEAGVRRSKIVTSNIHNIRIETSHRTECLNIECIAPSYDARVFVWRETSATSCIAILQIPIRLNKDPTKNVYLVIIYNKTWYFSESKTIDVHCRGAKVSFLSSQKQNMSCFSVRWMDLVWDSSSVVQSFNHSCMLFFLYNMIVKLIKKKKRGSMREKCKIL
jgi:hypothetical protein